MRTDDLISALSRDPAPVMPPVEKLLLRSLAISAPVALLVLVMTLGIRDDVVDAVGEGWFVWKLAVVALVAIAGWNLTRATAGPGRKLSLIGLALAVLALLAGDVADIVTMGTADWQERLFGDNWRQCLVSIPLLSLVPLIGMIYALRESAPTKPALTGAAAGLFAGAIGAFLYGLHCTDDSPLFLNAWYVAAVALTALAGATVGRLALKW
ncbi:MAG: NrsF family protein [Bosea sp. (in: a-proteobacteria)]